MNAGQEGDISARFIVSLHGPDGRPVGLGMVAGPRQIVTSAVVVNRAIGRPEYATEPARGTIEIRFPRVDQRSADPDRWTASVVRWSAPPAGAADPAADDFAGLLLDGELPEGVLPGRLGTGSAAHGTVLHIFGYPSDATKASGALATVQVRGEVQQPHIHVLTDPAVVVEERFGGSPAFDPATGTVLGLLVPPRPTDADESRYLLSADRIRHLWPDLVFPVRAGGVSVLHLADLGIGAAPDAHGGLVDDIASQIETSAIRPDLVVVSGDLTATGDMADFHAAFHWLDSLGARINLPRSKVVLVPGERDVSTAFLTRGYETERIMGVQPAFPYAYKWRPLAAAMNDFYRGSGRPSFDPGHPWSLHLFPGSRVAVAAANSTMAISHRPEDQYGLVSPAQVDDLAQQLVLFREQGWLRLAVVHHHPRAVGDRATGLDDGDEFLEGLGSGLVDLVLHGHAGDGHTPSRAGEPLLLGAGGAGRRYQLLRIDPSGLELVGRRFNERRGAWADDDSGQLSRPFDFRQSVEPGTPSGRPGLFERVRSATLMRGETVLDETGESTDLLIPRGDGVRRPQVVRALDGPVAPESIDSFATLIRMASLDLAPVRPVLVHAGPPAGTTLENHARDLGIDLVTLADYQRVVDLTPVLDRQRDRLAADDPHYLPQGFRYPEGENDGAQNDDLEAEMLSRMAVDAPLINVVCGDPGSGKSTLLRRLARHLSYDRAGAVPLLIDLAFADARTDTLDALLVGHLFRNGLRAIDADKVSYMVAEGRVVLLVDGLDDLAVRTGRDHAQRFLQTLLTSATGRTKLVVTARPGWVSSDADVVELVELSADRIEQYLRNRLADAPNQFRSTIALLGRSTHLASLARNPRMLSFLAALDEEAIGRAVRAPGQAAVYRELVDSYALDQPSSPARTAAEWIEEWSGLALAMAKNSTRALRPTTEGELGSIVRRTHDTISFLDDSIADWLVAAAAARAWPNDLLLRTVPLSELMAMFLIEILGTESAREWAGRPQRPDGAARGNAALLRRRLAEIAARQPVPPPSVTGHEDLRDQDLRQEDLGRRRLVGADLRGANLRGMILKDIDLTGARLEGADLRGVRMVGGTIENAALAGSRWNGAFLARTAGVPHDAPALDAAAIAERDEPALHAVAGGMVNCLAVSTTTGLIAIGRGDIVEIIERVQNQPGQQGLRTLRQLPGHLSTVRDVAFAGPEDQLVVSGSEDGTVRVWDLDTGRQVGRPIEAHPQPVNAVGAVGDRIVTGSADGTTRMWSLDGEVIDFAAGSHSGEILSMAISPDCGTFVTASADMTAAVRDLRTGAPLFRLNHGDAVTAVAYSHDGTLIATAANDGEAIIWSAGSGTRRTTLPVGGAPTGVTFSHDDRMIACSRSDGSTWLWDIVGHESRGQSLRDLSGHADRVTAVTFAPWDPAEVLTVAGDGTVRAWNSGTGRPVSTLDSDTYWASGLAFRQDPDGLRLFASTWDGAIATWNLTRGWTEPALGDHAGALSGVAWSPEAGLVAAGQLLDPPIVMLWDSGGRKVAELKGHDDGITDVVFSPDGRLLASASEDRSIGIWDPHDHVLLHRLRHGSGVVGGLAFEPAIPARPHSRLAVGHGRDVLLWDVTSGELVDDFKLEHDRPVTAVAFLHSGDRILTATRGPTPTIRELNDPRATPTPLRGHTGAVNCLAVSPDDSKVATGSSDNSVRIFDTRGRPIRTLTDPRATLDPGHAGGVLALAFSPDNRLLASSARDNTVRIWDTSTWHLLATLHILRDSGSMMIRADRAYRLAGDSAAGVWWALRRNRFELSAIADHIRSPRPLTSAEWLIPPAVLPPGDA